MRGDEIGVLEAAYRLDGSESEWLEGLARAAAPLLDEGGGISASTWTAPPRLAPRAVAVVGGPSRLSEAVGEAFRSASANVQLALFRAGPVSTLLQSAAARFVAQDPGSQAILRLGSQDCVIVHGADPSGHSLVLQSYHEKPARLPRAWVSRWSRVAIHLAAGFRLRRGLDALGAHGPDVLRGSEAIFSSAGRLEHAEGLAQHAHKLLAHGVLGVHQARGSLRSDNPDAALEAWKGLVAGRWSLVDHVDTDGKRFLVARKNTAALAAPSAVTAREQQLMAARARGSSVKLIAYELGLSCATVSRGLQSGMVKLGIVNEAELAALFSLTDA